MMPMRGHTAGLATAPGDSMIVGDVLFMVDANLTAVGRKTGDFSTLVADYRCVKALF
jgi:glyoxylase-like metal-dependent hydrolase (beta-lactamase superfamily II)